jgi:hypothetical protein
LFDDNLTAAAKKEVEDLLHNRGSAKGLSEEEVETRLFKIFIQKEEMRK